MNDKTLQRILGAFIRRIPVDQLNALCEAASREQYAGMNLGIGSQIAAHRHTDDVLEQAVALIGEHDKETITNIIHPPFYEVRVHQGTWEPVEKVPGEEP